MRSPRLKRLARSRSTWTAPRARPLTPSNTSTRSKSAAPSARNARRAGAERPMPSPLQILITMVLLAILAFCAFGFLATFEYAEQARRLPWQIGYGLIGALCVVGIIVMLLGRP